jgi:hypothetical protein
MKDNTWLPLMIGGALIGLLVAVVLLPPDMLDIRPDTADPVADAGLDATFNFGQSAFLDGSGSSDDKGIESYEWMIVNGHETVFLRGPQVNFLFGAPGEYTVTLTVTDTVDNKDSDTVIITII